MSRIDDEYIMAVVRNRSGVDSGEIDYSIACAKFDSQNVRSLKEMKGVLKELLEKVENRIHEKGRPEKCSCPRAIGDGRPFDGVSYHCTLHGR